MLLSASQVATLKETKRVFKMWMKNGEWCSGILSFDFQLATFPEWQATKVWIEQTYGYHIETSKQSDATQRFIINKRNKSLTLKEQKKDLKESMRRDSWPNGKMWVALATRSYAHWEVVKVWIEQTYGYTIVATLSSDGKGVRFDIDRMHKTATLKQTKKQLTRGMRRDIRLQGSSWIEFDTIKYAHWEAAKKWIERKYGYKVSVTITSDVAIRFDITK